MRRLYSYLPLTCPGRDVECDSECGSSGEARHGGGGQAHHQDQQQHRQGKIGVHHGAVALRVLEFLNFTTKLSESNDYSFALAYNTFLPCILRSEGKLA